MGASQSSQSQNQPMDRHMPVTTDVYAKHRTPGLQSRRGLPASNPRLALTKGVGRRGGLANQVKYKQSLDPRGEVKSVRNQKKHPNTGQLFNPRAMGAMEDNYTIKGLRKDRLIEIF
jgi:hypothetical protein